MAGPVELASERSEWRRGKKLRLRREEREEGCDSEGEGASRRRDGEERCDEGEEPEGWAAPRELLWPMMKEYSRWTSPVSGEDWQASE